MERWQKDILIGYGVLFVFFLIVFIVCAIVVHEQYTVKSDDQRKMTKKQSLAYKVLGTIGLIVSIPNIIIWPILIYDTYTGNVEKFLS
jgi:uncharacterized membrane protein